MINVFRVSLIFLVLIAAAGGVERNLYAESWDGPFDDDWGFGGDGEFGFFDDNGVFHRFDDEPDFDDLVIRRYSHQGPPPEESCCDWKERLYDETDLTYGDDTVLENDPRYPSRRTAHPPRNSGVNLSPSDSGFDLNNPDFSGRPRSGFERGLRKYFRIPYPRPPRLRITRIGNTAGPLMLMGGMAIEGIRNLREERGCKQLDPLTYLERFMIGRARRAYHGDGADFTDKDMRYYSYKEGWWWPTFDSSAGPNYGFNPDTGIFEPTRF